MLATGFVVIFLDTVLAVVMYVRMNRKPPICPDCGKEMEQHWHCTPCELEEY